MIPFESLSIRHRLLLIVILAVFPALILILWNGFEQRAEELEQAQQDLQGILRDLAGYQERMAARTEQFLITLSEIPAIRNGDREAAAAILRKAAHGPFPLETLLAADATGAVFAQSRPASPEINIAGWRHFKDAVGTGKLSIGDCWVDQATGAWTVPFAYPVRDRRGHLLALVSVGLGLQYFDTLLKEPAELSDTRLTINDRRGRIIYEFPKRTARKGDAEASWNEAASQPAEAGTYWSREPDGVRRLVAFRKLRLRPEEPPYLFLRAGISESRVTAAARSVRNRSLILMLVAGVLAGGFGLILGQIGLVVPIRGLASAAGRLGSGDLAVRSRMGGFGGDLGKLARAFDEMAASLEERETERDRAARNLRKTQFSLDRALDSILWIGAAGNIQYCNDSAVTLLGYSRDELLQMTIFEIDPAAIPEKWPARWENLRKQKSVAFETTQKAKDGRILQVEVVANWMEVEGGEINYCFIRDITARKESEARLQMVRYALDQAADGMLWVASDGRILFANQVLARMLEYSQSELEQMTVSEIDANLPAESWSRHWEKVWRWGATRMHTRHKTKSGRILPVEVSISPQEYEGQEFHFTCVRNISLRLEAQEALRRSQEKFARIFHTIPDAVLLHRLDGKVLDLNDGFVRLLGILRSEATGYTVPALKFWVDNAQYEHLVAQVAEHGEAEGLVAEFRRKDGSLFLGLVKGKRLELAGVPCSLTVISDISERQRAEEALRQAQKLESLGVLAGGIAHDFNNLLTAIVGNLNLAQFALPEDSPAGRFLESAVGSVVKAADLTRQLLAYSGRGPIQVQSQSINRILKGMTDLLRLSITKNTVIRFQLGESLPEIKGDAAQIQQAVMNLVTNAAEAIGDGEGVIRIATGRVDLSERDTERFALGPKVRPGPHVFVDVSDSGCGIPPDVMERVFDPFFSTKLSGRGLGLSALLGIVRGHNGGIEIESQVGRGTTVRLLFPAVFEIGVPEFLPTIKGSARVEGTVLLVDDEPEILRTTGEALEQLGLKVLTAADGVAALAVFAQHQQAIDLVLIDMTMPKMDGRDVFRVLKGMRSDVRVILTGCPSDTVRNAEGFGHGWAGVLEKPYRLPVLQETVRSVLLGMGPPP